MAIQTINPFNNEVVKDFDEMNPIQLKIAISIADEAYQSWKKTSFNDRAELLSTVAKLMRAQKHQLARLITLEMGKLLSQSYGEIELSADIIDYYASNGESFLQDEILTLNYGEAYLKSTPIGVLLGVEPWNFPFYQVARFAAPNIMAGNVVLIKHASNVPQCALAIQRLFEEAQAPQGVYTNLFLSGGRVDEVVGDPRVKGISLTGSEAAGSSIAASAGKSLKKSVLELGGSDAFIVLEDADMDQAVHWAVIGRMNNTGQCCVAAKRIIVIDTIAEEFLAKFIAKLSNLNVGDPMDADTELGPLSSQAAVNQLKDQIQRSVDKGAKILLGGNLIDRPGAFIEATILGGLKPGMPAYHEELFGPVASYYVVSNEQEAIDLANDSPYGLGCSIFTSNTKRGQLIAEQIDTGMVFINHPTWTQPNLPFGGTKGSGYGRELSSHGIQEFINKKLIRTSELTDPF